MLNTSSVTIRRDKERAHEFGALFDSHKRIVLHPDSDRAGFFMACLAAHRAAGVPFGPIPAKKRERILTITRAANPEHLVNQARKAYSLDAERAFWWSVPIPGWIENKTSLAEAMAKANPTLVIIEHDLDQSTLNAVLQRMRDDARLIAITDDAIPDSHEWFFEQRVTTAEGGNYRGVEPDAFSFRHEDFNSWWNGVGTPLRKFQFVRATRRRGGKQR